MNLLSLSFVQAKIVASYVVEGNPRSIAQLMAVVFDATFAGSHLRLTRQKSYLAMDDFAWSRFLIGEILFTS